MSSMMVGFPALDFMAKILFPFAVTGTLIYVFYAFPDVRYWR